MHSHTENAFSGYGPFSMPSPDHSVVARREGGVTVIDLPGPLVGELVVHDLRDRLLDLLALGAKNFAINLAEVPYADSYGIGGLAAAYNLVRHRGGRIKFFAAPARLVRMLASLRLDTVFELFEDESSALSSF